VITDSGGTGGTRSDVLRFGGHGDPQIQSAGAIVTSVASLSGGSGGIAGSASTVNNQRGTISLSAGVGTVTLSNPMPDTTYRVATSVDQNENVWITSKTTTSFTVNSSNGASTAHVDWMISR